MAMMISWVKPVNPSHPYLENDTAPSFDPPICAFHLGFSLGSDVAGALPLRHVRANLIDDCQCCEAVHAVAPGQAHPRHPKQVRPDIEAGCVSLIAMPVLPVTLLMTCWSFTFIWVSAFCIC